MNTMIDVEQYSLVDILDDEIAATNQKDTAKKYGISPQYLNDVIKRKRAIGKKLANAMGFSPVRVFRWMGLKHE